VRHIFSMKREEVSEGNFFFFFTVVRDKNGGLYLLNSFSPEGILQEPS
jgi:hypothetical protein